MIKALAGDMIIIGLSDENMKRLKEDQPIHFNLSELGLENREVLIFAGKDEESMAEHFRIIFTKNEGK
jgi:hypothetical protein